MPFDRAVWLAPLAFAVHIGEEAPGFTRWVNGRITGEYEQGDFVRINTAGMAMTLGATWFVARRPSRPLVFAYFVAVVSQQAANTAFHAGATVAHRAYSPGLVSSIALYLPLWRALAQRAQGDGLRGPPAGVPPLTGVGRFVYPSR